MGNQIPKPGGYSFAAKQKAMLAVLFTVALLDFVVCAGSVREVNRETAEQMSRIVRMQIDTAYRECLEVSSDMRRLLMENQDMTALAVNGTVRERIYAKGKLLEKMGYSFGDRENYHPFFYFEQTGELLGASWIDLRDAEEAGIVDVILEKVADEGELLWDLYRWEQFEWGGEHYMLRAYCYNGVWILCYVPASVMVADLDALYAGEENSVVLLGEGGEILAGKQEAERLGLPKEALLEGAAFFAPWNRILVVTEKSRELDISIAVIMSGYGGFSKILLIWAIVFFTVLITLISFVIFMVYTRKRIIKPVQKFIRGVSSYDPKGEGEAELSGNDILELEQVNEQFRGFVRQIRNLKIDIYEQELLRQKLEMDNMRLQLKPHFFLNSLGTVVSLLQNGRSRDAVNMCQATIRYLRYLFQAGLDETTIREAILHVEDYFDIMKVRYPDEVEIDLYAEEETGSFLIPPLVIQTLVENSFKYGKTAGKVLEVSVTVTLEQFGEEKCLCINVSDNGSGYKEEYLRLWESGKELPGQDGKHIGIANMKARLQYVYGKKAVVRFYNSPMGGAVTEIRIPLHLVREEMKRECTVSG